MRLQLFLISLACAVLIGCAPDNGTITFPKFTPPMYGPADASTAPAPPEWREFRPDASNPVRRGDQLEGSSGEWIFVSESDIGATYSNEMRFRRFE